MLLQWFTCILCQSSCNEISVSDPMAITGTELLGRVPWQSYLIQHGSREDVGIQQEGNIL